ncbi:arginase family protein [Taklimakanibacter deserti]|uniref:arginase family protein n=1 Tax=Taklimakanibacter deserti TaxID=2267839 RepID=UPI000E658904
MKLKKPPIAFLGSRFSASARDFDVALFGAPHGTPYRGIDNRPYERAPNVLRKALKADQTFIESWDFDFGGPLLGKEHKYRLADLGDLPTQSKQAARNRKMIEDCTRAVLANGALPIMIGGDDSTPIPFIQAFSDQAPITILQIDAHIDWREERYGEPLGFSSTMRRASEMKHVEKIVQVGMRGMGSAREKEVQDAEAWGAKLITAADIHERGIGLALDEIEAGASLLITLDCDALDWSIMPAVAYPTTGGLTHTQVTRLIQDAIAKARLVGFDLIEFVSRRDRDGIGAFTAARLICNVIGSLANR